MLSPDNLLDDSEDKHSPGVYDLGYEEICFLPDS
jgi:hypothetical protein